MSETKHTPGTWELWGRPDPSQVIAAPGTFVAQTVGGNDVANARLIAAAPDLLELATALLSAIEKFAITNTSDEDTIGVLSDAAREVIAAATGATP